MACEVPKFPPVVRAATVAVHLALIVATNFAPRARDPGLCSAGSLRRDTSARSNWDSQKLRWVGLDANVGESRVV